MSIIHNYCICFLIIMCRCRRYFKVNGKRRNVGTGSSLTPSAHIQIFAHRSARPPIGPVEWLHTDTPTTILTVTCFPSQQTTQCSPAVPSVQPLLVSGTIYNYPFEQRHLSTSSDDTWRLICSPSPLPLTNKPYRPRLRFESSLTYGALQVLFTYLL